MRGASGDPDPSAAMPLEPRSHPAHTKPVTLLRFEGFADHGHPGFLRRPVTLHTVTGLARGHEVEPGVPATTAARQKVVHGVGVPAAVGTDVLVSAQDPVAGDAV